MAEVPPSPKTPKSNRRRSWFRSPQSSSASSALAKNDTNGSQSSRGRRYRRYDPTRVKSADVLEQLQLLGTGSYGQVYKVQHKRSGQHYALKILSREKMKEQNMLAQMQEERRIMSALPPHPHIVGLYSSWSHRDQIYLLLELVEGKDLFELVRSNTRLKGDKAARYLLQMAKGLDFLHQQFILSRDLKLENVLYNAGSDTVLLTDFGLAKMLASAKSTTTTICGTVQYMAPELLRNEAYDLRLDWWCLGVIAYIMLVGKYPYSRGPEKLAFDRSAKDRTIMLQRIAQHPLEFYRPVAEAAQEVVTQLLCVDVERRISTHAELSTFSWFSFSTAARLADNTSSSGSEDSSMLSVPASASVDSIFHDHDGTFTKPHPPFGVTPSSTPSPPPVRRSASPTVASPSRLHHVVSAFDAPQATHTPTASPARDSSSSKKTRGRRHKRPDPDEFTEDDDIFELLRKYNHRRKQNPHLLPYSFTCSPRTLIRTEGVRASISAGSRPTSPERSTPATPTRHQNRRGTWTHLFHSRQSSLSGTAVGSDTKSLTDLFGIIQDIQGMQYQDQRSPRPSSSHEVVLLRHNNDDTDDGNDSDVSGEDRARTDAMVQMLSTTPGVTSADKHDTDDSNDSAWNNVSAAFEDAVHVVQPTRLFDDDDDDNDDNTDGDALRKSPGVSVLVYEVLDQPLGQSQSECAGRLSPPLEEQLPTRPLSTQASPQHESTSLTRGDLSTSPPPLSPVHVQSQSPCQSPTMFCNADPDVLPSGTTATQRLARLSSNASSSAGSSPSHRPWRSLFRKREGSPAKLHSDTPPLPSHDHVPTPVVDHDVDEVAPPRDRILSTVSMMQAAPLVLVLEPDELETMV